MKNLVSYRPFILIFLVMLPSFCEWAESRYYFCIASWRSWNFVDPQVFLQFIFHIDKALIFYGLEELKAVGSDEKQRY